MAHTGAVRSDGRGLVGGTELGGDALLGPCGDDDYDLAPCPGFYRLIYAFQG